MRLIAFIAAFGIILLSSYWLVKYGYPHFYRTTGSTLASEIMLLCSIGFASLSVIYVVKRLP